MLFLEKVGVGHSVKGNFQLEFLGKKEREKTHADLLGKQIPLIEFISTFFYSFIASCYLLFLQHSALLYIKLEPRTDAVTRKGRIVVATTASRNGRTTMIVVATDDEP